MQSHGRRNQRSAGSGQPPKKTATLHSFDHEGASPSSLIVRLPMPRSMVPIANASPAPHNTQETGTASSVVGPAANLSTTAQHGPCGNESNGAARINAILGANTQHVLSTRREGFATWEEELMLDWFKMHPAEFAKFRKHQGAGKCNKRARTPQRGQTNFANWKEFLLGLIQYAKDRDSRFSRTFDGVRRRYAGMEQIFNAWQLLLKDLTGGQNPRIIDDKDACGLIKNFRMEFRNWKSQLWIIDDLETIIGREPIVGEDDVIEAGFDDEGNADEDNEENGISDPHADDVEQQQRTSQATAIIGEKRLSVAQAVHKPAKTARNSLIPLPVTNNIQSIICGEKPVLTRLVLNAKAARAEKHHQDTLAAVDRLTNTVQSLAAPMTVPDNLIEERLQKLEQATSSMDNRLGEILAILTAQRSTPQ